MMNICRVCLAETLADTTKIDYSLDGIKTVAQVVEFVSGVNVQINDHLPQTVCQDCLSNVIIAFNVKETCLNSDKFLRSQLECLEEEGDQQITANDDGTEKYDLDQNPLVLFDNDLEVERFKFDNDSPTAIECIEEEHYETTQIFIENIEKSSEPNRLKCYICGKISMSKKEKVQHLKSEHSENDLKCYICHQYRSKTIKGYDNHLMVHQFPNLLSHICHICSKTYRTAAEIRRHIKLSHSDKSKRRYDFICDLCDFTTFIKMNLKRHIKTVHLKVKNYQCQICPDKKYTSKVALDQHLIIKHGQRSDFVCTSCSRKFPAMSSLKTHMRFCSGNPKTFRERSDPNSYREKIDDTENYRCKICQIVCEGKSKIAQHFAQRHKHDNTCTICSATFYSYSSLKKHIQILHYKIHKHKCETCGKSFGQKNQLKSHENTHTGAKPFKCKYFICHFRSGDLSVLSRHQKKCFRNPLNQFDRIIE